MIDTIQNISQSVGPDPVLKGPSHAQREERNEPTAAVPVHSADPAGVLAAGSSEDVVRVVQEINNMVHQVSGTKISFDVDAQTGRAVVKVLNKETGDVIRQLPTEELLNLVFKMEQLSGLIFSQEV